MSETCMCWGFPGDGWFKLIWELSEKLEKFDVTADQVKSKFASLRYYYTLHSDDSLIRADEQISKFVKKAVVKSTKTCEVCGKCGKTISLNGWVSTLCTKCYKAWKDRLNEVK
jgi:uncharacterized CHY-type Zn-finger protein